MMYALEISIVVSFAFLVLVLQNVTLFFFLCLADVLDTMKLTSWTFFFVRAYHESGVQVADDDDSDPDEDTVVDVNMTDDGFETWSSVRNQVGVLPGHEDFI